MNEENARRFIEAFKKAGINFIAYMPDSVLNNIERKLEEDPYFTAVSVANESCGIGVCSGASLAGKKSAMLMESPGFLLTPYALARLPLLFGLPIILLIVHRGESGDGVWWSAHSGPATTRVLESLNIPHQLIDVPDQIEPAILGASKSVEVNDMPRAILVGRGLMH